MSSKQEILNLLFQSKNNWVSGDELAKKLNISRTMIWKYIKTLKDDGFQINSKRSLGYQLQAGYTLNAPLIQSQLQSDVDIKAFKTINSTNTYLKEYLGTHLLQKPLVVVAGNQTNGYGRFKRSFYSPANGGLYLSLAVPVHHHPINPSLITTSIAVGVIHTLKEFFPKKDFKVKWVNDIYLNHKKIAGILTEATADLESLSPSELIIGVGINLTTQDFPSELKKTAQAISDVLPVDLNIIASSLIDHLMDILGNYDDGHYLTEYKQLLNLMNKQVDIQVGQKVIHTTVKDLNDVGGLVVEDQYGNLKTYYSGEIQKIYF